MNSKFPHNNAPIKLFRNPKSGHCHRVQLMMSLLDIPYETIDLDMGSGAHKKSEYLKISPLGQVPAINDNGTTLADSNAILIYLIRKYGDDHNWYPTTPVKAAQVQRWLSIAAGEIAYGPAAARLVKLFGASRDWDVAATIAQKIFSVMEDTLGAQAYLTGETITAADIAVYSYTAHAEEGAINLEPYPNIRSWLSRIEALPKFVGMARSTNLATG